MFKTYAEKVRQKPIAKRKTLLFGWSAGLTAVIALIWFVNFTYVSHINNLENKRLMAEAEKRAEQGYLTIEDGSGTPFALKIRENLAAVAEGGRVIYQAIFNRQQ